MAQQGPLLSISPGAQSPFPSTHGCWQVYDGGPHSPRPRGPLHRQFTPSQEAAYFLKTRRVSLLGAFSCLGQAHSGESPFDELKNQLIWGLYYIHKIPSPLLYSVGQKHAIDSIHTQGRGLYKSIKCQKTGFMGVTLGLLCHRQVQLTFLFINIS